MQIDYEKLASIAADPTSRSTMAKDTSEVLASYMQILSNLIFAAERLSESEMAMIVSSLNRWVTKKKCLRKSILWSWKDCSDGMG